MRLTFCSSIIAATLVIPFRAAAQTYEYDIDRVGGDFDRIQLAFDKPSLCAALCRQSQGGLRLAAA